MLALPKSTLTFGAAALPLVLTTSYQKSDPVLCDGSELIDLFCKLVKNDATTIEIALYFFDNDPTDVATTTGWLDLDAPPPGPADTAGVIACRPRVYQVTAADFGATDYFHLGMTNGGRFVKVGIKKTGGAGSVTIQPYYSYRRRQQGG